MRVDLRKDPSIIVDNQDQFENIKNLVSNQKKSLLNEEEYKKSVHKASKLMKDAAFTVIR